MGCRLIYVSDVHLRRRRSESLIEQVTVSVLHWKPDAVLLGSDPVDASSPLNNLRVLVGRLSEVRLVMGGNRDSSVGIDRVRDAVPHGGGQWTHTGVVRFMKRRVLVGKVPVSAKAFLSVLLR